MNFALQNSIIYALCVKSEIIHKYYNNEIMLILTKNLSYPYTLRGILECEYPELLETAESGCTLLTELQNALINLLPSSQKLLPCNIEQLAGVEAQANFMTYIYYHSLFAFAHWWKRQHRVETREINEH